MSHEIDPFEVDTNQLIAEAITVISDMVPHHVNFAITIHYYDPLTEKPIFHFFYNGDPYAVVGSLQSSLRQMQRDT